MIVYFSGTGNSRYCAEYLASALQDERLDAAGFIRRQIAAELITGKPWVFVSPTYAWQLPRVFEQFIRSGAFSGAEDAYFVMTCGEDIGNAGVYIEKLCQSVGLRYRGVMPIVMPENYIAMFDVPDEKQAAEIIASARPYLQEVVSLIRQNLDFPRRKITGSDKMKSGLVNAVFYRLFVKAKDFYATDACVGCGLCADQCILNNIQLLDGKPVWGNQCTHCMACICGCPKEAIEYGSKSKGKPRYWCK